jgi:hypothetical protein
MSSDAKIEFPTFRQPSCLTLMKTSWLSYPDEDTLAVLTWWRHPGCLTLMKTPWLSYPDEDKLAVLPWWRHPGCLTLMKTPWLSYPDEDTLAVLPWWRQLGCRNVGNSIFASELLECAALFYFQTAFNGPVSDKQSFSAQQWISITSQSTAQTRPMSEYKCASQMTPNSLCSALLLTRALLALLALVKGSAL